MGRGLDARRLRPGRRNRGAPGYADNGQQHAWVAGGRLDLDRRLSARASGLARFDVEYARYDNDGDTETHARWVTVAALELLRTFWAGAGFEYRDIGTRLKTGWQWDDDHPEKQERNADIYGPLLYGAWKGAWGRGTMGWDIEAAWLFYDMGELGGLGFDGSHVRLTAAAVFHFRKLQWKAGYLLERFEDLPGRVSNGVFSSRNTVQGPFASLAVQF